MDKQFFFYDLETSGLNPAQDRIMQFAGIRTDMEINQIGEPINLIVKLNDDTLPSPEAILTTGLTPQQTIADGFSEADFAKKITEEVFLANTIVVGFNNIRFDDDFIRYLLWRNFYDPYEWAYKDGRSRWDMLDVVRMTRALRPDGIKWPTDEDGQATNRLELIAKNNNLNHTKSHDALSDVEALIGLTRLIRQKQPQLFNYLFKMRDKNEVKKLVNLDNKQPFVYVSGRFDSEFDKATVAFPLTAGRNGSVVVFDLRSNPSEIIKQSKQQMKARLLANKQQRQAPGYEKLPFKEMHYNKAPAVAPLTVLSSNDGWTRIRLDEAQIKQNIKIILDNPGFAENVRDIFQNLDNYQKSSDPEAMLYDGFIPDGDKTKLKKIRQLNGQSLADFHPGFIDERLEPLLLHYKARNFPEALAEDETLLWEKWRAERINQQLPAFMDSLKRLATGETDESRLFILQELQLWAESIVPTDY